MKTIVETTEGEGLEGLLGEKVLLMCVNYFYCGKLVGVNDTCVKIEAPEIVYETGAWDEKGFSDSQALPNKFHYIQTNAIESFGAIDD